jgi:tRNA acetyltransferase TAN1
MDDIESSIQREVASMGKKQNHTKLIAPVRLDLQCVLFFKIRPPIEPVDFVHRICKEVVSTPSIRRMKYINRLTPMALMGKATEKGLEEVGRVVLGQHFNLREDQENTMEDEGHEGRKVESQKIPNHSVSVMLSDSPRLSPGSAGRWQAPKSNWESLDESGLIFVTVRNSAHYSQSHCPPKKRWYN